LAYIYAVAGKQSKSHGLLEDALKLSDERQSNNWNLAAIAAIYASIGDADRTFQWLEKALAARDDRPEGRALLPAICILSAIPEDRRHGGSATVTIRSPSWFYPGA